MAENVFASDIAILVGEDSSSTAGGTGVEATERLLRRKSRGGRIRPSRRGRRRLNGRTLTDQITDAESDGGQDAESEDRPPIFP